MLAVSLLEVVMNLMCCLDEYNKGILSILEDLQCPPNLVKGQSEISLLSVQTEQCRLSGSFVSDAVFNLSRKVLTDTEVKLLGLDFASIQTKLNESELQRDFKNFYRRIRRKWYFMEEITIFFSLPSFSPKSSRSPQVDHPNLELFLSQIEHELFLIPDKRLTYSNLTKEEWQAIRSLADDRSIVIRKTDKDVVVRDRDDYL